MNRNGDYLALHEKIISQVFLCVLCVSVVNLIFFMKGTKKGPEER